MGNTFSCNGCFPFRRRLRLKDSDYHEKLEDPLPNPCQLFRNDEDYPNYGLLKADEEPYEVRFCSHLPEGRCACDEWTESRHWRLVAGLDDWTQLGIFEGLQPRPRQDPLDKAAVRPGLLQPGETPPRYALLRSDEMPDDVRNCMHVRYEGESMCDCDQWLESRHFRIANRIDDINQPGVRDGLVPPARKSPTIRLKRRRYTSISIPPDNEDQKAQKEKQ